MQIYFKGNWYNQTASGGYRCTYVNGGHTWITTAIMTGRQIILPHDTHGITLHIAFRSFDML